MRDTEGKERQRETLKNIFKNKQNKKKKLETRGELRVHVEEKAP